MADSSDCASGPSNWVRKRRQLRRTCSKPIVDQRKAKWLTVAVSCPSYVDFGTKPNGVKRSMGCEGQRRKQEEDRVDSGQRISYIINCPDEA